MSRCDECGGKVGDGYEVHTDACRSRTFPEPHLAMEQDETELARRLREALWPGGDHGSGPKAPRDRD